VHIKENIAYSCKDFPPRLTVTKFLALRSVSHFTRIFQLFRFFSRAMGVILFRNFAVKWQPLRQLCPRNLQKLPFLSCLRQNSALMMERTTKLKRYLISILFCLSSPSLMWLISQRQLLLLPGNIQYLAYCSRWMSGYPTKRVTGHRTKPVCMSSAFIT